MEKKTITNLRKKGLMGLMGLILTVTYNFTQKNGLILRSK